MARSLLLSCEAVSKAYGTRSLFESCRSGSSKATRPVSSAPTAPASPPCSRSWPVSSTPDRGTRSLRGGVRVGYVPQDPVLPPGVTVEDVIAVALAGVDEGDRPGRIAQALGRAGFADGRADVDTLSGGWSKRLAIARELAAAPDVLLMDEPTNHLDVEGILWLEGVLAERARAVLVVSHDRYFLEHVATRMLELNRAYPARPLPDRRALQRLPRPPRRLPARAGGLRGVARQHRAARDRVAAARRQGALHQGQGAHQGGGPAHRGARRRPRAGRRRRPPGSTSPPRSAGPAGCSPRAG